MSESINDIFQNLEKFKEHFVYLVIFAGYIADTIGRRYTALVMDVPFIVAWTAIIFANSASVLYFARFTIGRPL